MFALSNYSTIHVQLLKLQRRHCVITHWNIKFIYWCESGDAVRKMPCISHESADSAPTGIGSLLTHFATYETATYTTLKAFTSFDRTWMFFVRGQTTDYIWNDDKSTSKLLVERMHAFTSSIIRMLKLKLKLMLMLMLMQYTRAVVCLSRQMKDCATIEQNWWQWWKHWIAARNFF